MDPAAAETQLFRCDSHGADHEGAIADIGRHVLLAEDHEHDWCPIERIEPLFPAADLPVELGEPGDLLLVRDSNDDGRLPAHAAWRPESSIDNLVYKVLRHRLVLIGADAAAVMDCFKSIFHKYLLQEKTCIIQENSYPMCFSACT